MKFIIPHPSSRAGVGPLITRENTDELYSGIKCVEEDGNCAVHSCV